MIKNNKKYWTIILDNYQGEYEKFYFENRHIAEINFANICKKHENFDEFKKDTENENFWECSWFDAEFSDMSTVVYLQEEPITVFNSVIF